MTNPENPPIEVTPAVVDTIAQQLPDGVTPQVVQAVLATWNTIREGDPPGVVRVDEATGNVARRCSIDGIHMWVITEDNGTTTRDTQPTLPWRQIWPLETTNAEGA